MADERGGMIIGDRLEARLDRLEQGMVRLETGFEQMDKRMGTLERFAQWTLGIVLSTWITTMLAIIAMSWTILSRLK